MSDQPSEGDSAEFEAILVTRRETAATRNPDVRLRGWAILKDGPRAKKVVTHWMIIDRNTGNLHHHAM